MPCIAGSRPDPIPKIPNAIIIFFSLECSLVVKRCQIVPAMKKNGVRASQSIMYELAKIEELM